METEVSHGEWIRQWMALLDREQPGWRDRYDADAFELALEDLYGADGTTRVSSGELEILGEFTLRRQEETEALTRGVLGADGPFGRRVVEFEYIFRVSHGSSRESGDLRTLRREAMKNLVDAVFDPLVRRFGQIGHAMEMRERRYMKRHPVFAEPGPVPDVREAAPEAEAVAREAAERVTRRAKKELAPEAMGAIRRLLLDPEGGPACTLAAAAGISPATLSRAIKRFRAIASEELDGCRESVIKPFYRALLDRLKAA